MATGKSQKRSAVGAARGVRPPDGRLSRTGPKPRDRPVSDSPAAAGSRFWLIKSEPSVFSIQDLAKAPKRTTSWEGVRNYQARNLLRDEVKAGDRVLFWHSSADVTGAAGIAEVVRAAYPDPTQFDAKSEYHDPGSARDAPRWVTVDVRWVETFGAPVTAEAIRGEPRLAAMDVLRRGNRLSVQRVKEEEFELVVGMGRGKK